METSSGGGMLWRGGPLTPLASGAKKRRVSPMHKSPPFSLSSSPPTQPGRSGYLRGMLNAPRYSVAPIGGLVTES